MSRPRIRLVVSCFSLVFVLTLSSHAFAQGAFLRGDANGDGDLDIADALAIVELLFRDVSDVVTCQDAADVNDDGRLDAADVTGALAYMFMGGDTPPGPFEACGTDPTEDELSCTSSTDGCEEPTPEPTPEATPEPTPEATPEPTPEATPEPTPEATPEPTPDPDINPSDVIGSISISQTESDCFGGDLASGIDAFFVAVDIGNIGQVCEEAEFETVAGCAVTSQTCCPSQAGSGFPDVTGFDPGTPGLATSDDGGQVNIVRRPDPPMPPDFPNGFIPDAIEPGLFSTPENVDVEAEGLNPGDEITISFPGGEDIAAFSCKIDWPPRIENFLPACGFMIDGALNVSWTDAEGYDDVVEVTVSRSVSTFIPKLQTRTVTIRCEFPDNAGTGTIPAAAIARLPTEVPPLGTGSVSTSITAARTNQKAVNVTVNDQSRQMLKDASSRVSVTGQ